MHSLDQQAQPIAGELYGGAFIGYKSREFPDERWALPAKWYVPGRESGPIGCIMGACYSIRRSWYRKIDEPLKILAAWGGDEEIMSIASHLMGGTVDLLPIPVGHIYGAKHQGRLRSDEQNRRIWGNRYAVVDSIPMEEAEREDLFGWMKRSTPPGAGWDRHEAAALRKVLASGPVTWEAMKEQGIVRPATMMEMCGDRCKRNLLVDSARYIPPAPPGDKRQIINQPVIRCELCGARDSFRVIRGPRGWISYARCVNCGHKGQIRKVT